MKPNTYKRSTWVRHNSEVWIIVENIDQYKLMPYDCLQNKGQLIYLPLDTIFERSIYIEYGA